MFPPAASHMKTLPALVIIWCLHAAAPALAADDEDKPVAGFQFELLPRSFQKRPLVDVHVITEMTPAGRQQPAPTAAQPVYYLTRPAGQLALGLGATSDEKPADVAKLEEMMKASLAVSHYLPAKEKQQPNIVIIYSWGSHSAPLGQGDLGVDEAGTADTGEARETMTRELLERAKLVGGEKFTQELIQALNEEATRRRSGASFGMMNPMEQFRNRNAKTMAMLEDIGGSIYFVVASAYDAASIATNKRVLLWRTKMATRASGVNLLESMPSLIVTAGPYFGKEMAESESVRRRLNRGGSVELAPLELLGFDDDPAKLVKDRRDPEPVQAPAAAKQP